MSLILCCYRALLFVATLLYLPKSLFRLSRGSIGKEECLIRLGLKIPSVQRKKKGPLFWVHAVSLGEMKSAIPFIRILQKRFPEVEVLVSTVTKTGWNEAKQLVNILGPIFFPSDLVSHKLVNELKPDLVCLVEGDIWPNFIHAAKQVIVVSAKISLKTYRFFRMCSWLKPFYFNPLQRIYVQDEIYLKRFLDLGFSKERCKIAGNMKMDQEGSVSYPKLPIRFLIASTHQYEEELLLKALLPLNIPIALAPRHPERFKEVEKLLLRLNIPYQLSSKKEIEDQSKLLLIDEMGVLPNYYSRSPVTFLGGSFIKGIGGHNLFEPLFYGSIPCFGPFIDKQLHAKELLLDHSAAFQIEARLIYSLLDRLTKEEQSQMKLQGKRLLERMKGASERTVAYISEFLLENKSSITV